MSDDNADTEHYVGAAWYAEELNLRVEDVIQQLRDGTLDGKISKNILITSWLVKVDEKMAEVIGRHQLAKFLKQRRRVGDRILAVLGIVYTN